jgi:small subunit ribosomal protein S11
MSKAKTDNRVKKRNKINVPVAVAHVSSTFNNIIVSITDVKGNVIAWSSAGFHGFKGSRKSTPYAAQITAEHAGKVAQECGVTVLSIEVKGPGAGRESALRALMSLGIAVSSIKDVTPIAHNGCRPPKRRRV